MIQIGELISKLETLIDSSDNRKLTFEDGKTVKGLGCYRGYYSDLALYTEDHETSFSLKGWEGQEYTEKNPLYYSLKVEGDTAQDLLDALTKALGNDFDGWKGGENTMDKDTVLWKTLDRQDCSDIGVTGIGQDFTSHDFILLTKRTGH